jgi:hypothetical protein
MVDFRVVKSLFIGLVHWFKQQSTGNWLVFAIIFFLDPENYPKKAILGNDAPQKYHNL